MAQIRTFKDLKVWAKAHELAVNTYKVTRFFPPEEKFGLTSQIRRSAVSIASNIVEGLRRKHLKDSLNFYNIADSSLEELKYQLLLSYDLKFIIEDDYSRITDLANQTGRMLYYWIKSQKQTK